MPHSRRNRSVRHAAFRGCGRAAGPQKRPALYSGKVPESKSLYGVSPRVPMAQKWIAELKAKTGRSLEEWLALLGKSGPADEKSRREWLKREHGLGTNYAMFLAERAAGKGAEMDTPAGYLAAAERFVDEMFAGGKAGLRPLYDELLGVCLAAGPEARACPCQTIVPLYRSHVFAQIKPATRTRLDLGFALGARKPQGRLVSTGGYEKKDRITHRIPIESTSDIDAEVKRWLRIAYEEDQ